MIHSVSLFELVIYSRAVRRSSQMLRAMIVMSKTSFKFTFFCESRCENITIPENWIELFPLEHNFYEAPEVS